MVRAECVLELDSLLRFAARADGDFPCHADLLEKAEIVGAPDALVRGA
jgi:hypothetical protein